MEQGRSPDKVIKVHPQASAEPDSGDGAGESGSEGGIAGVE
ncbi:hypothetical protein [Dendronalium sp. ChiSLP03b]